MPLFGVNVVGEEFIQRGSQHLTSNDPHTIPDQSRRVLTTLSKLLWNILDLFSDQLPFMSAPPKHPGIFQVSVATIASGTKESSTWNEGFYSLRQPPEMKSLSSMTQWAEPQRQRGVYSFWLSRVTASFHSNVGSELIWWNVELTNETLHWFLSQPSRAGSLFCR